MGFDAHVLKVLIASPGDTGRERDAIEKALHGWNNARPSASRSTWRRGGGNCTRFPSSAARLRRSSTARPLMPATW